MNLFNKIHSTRFHCGTHSFPTLIFALLLLFTSCRETPRPFSIIDFTSEVEVYNFSKSLNMYSNMADSLSQPALLAGDGDLIIFRDNYFYYRRATDNKFQFKAEKEGGYVNGKITTLNLPRRKDMTPWFKQMKSADLSALEFIKIDSLIPDSYLPYLTELAKLKPGTGLCYEGNLKDIAGLFKIFNPRFLIGGSLSGNDFGLLAGLNNLELLIIAPEGSAISNSLPHMPQLKQLFLIDPEKGMKSAPGLLNENKLLERVAIYGAGRIDLSFLRSLENLKELIVCSFDTIDNFNQIKNPKNLELLSISSQNFRYDKELNRLSGIRWINFPSYVTQDDFNYFVDNHPNLEVVEIIKNDTVKSLQRLSTLKNLYGLTITGTLTDMASVKSLKNLRFLSLPLELTEDSLTRTELQNALPGTRIVANQGFCLGSGWLLLIIPLILLFSILSRRKMQKAPGNL
jgi:hypothetical protein